MSSADYAMKAEQQAIEMDEMKPAQDSFPSASKSPQKPATTTPGAGMFGAMSAETTELGGGKSQGGGQKKAMVLGKAKKLPTNNITFE